MRAKYGQTTDRIPLDRKSSGQKRVWYGMLGYVRVWYGMVWYGMVWYGMVWYGVVWYAEHRL